MRSGCVPGEVGRIPEFRLLSTATLWGATVDQVQHASPKPGAHIYNP